MFGFLKKKISYLIEFIVTDPNSQEATMHHFVCQCEGELELSDIIHQFRGKEWNLVSSTQISNADAVRLQDILDSSESE